MAKTVSIRDDVYRKLLARKAKGESFSELLERLIGSPSANSVDVLAKLRGTVEFSKDSKAAMLSEVDSKRRKRF